MGTEQFLAADRDRFPLKVRRLERLSERMSRGAGHMCAGSSESVGICSDVRMRAITLQRCQRSADAVSINGSHIGQRAKVAEAKQLNTALAEEEATDLNNALPLQRVHIYQAIWHHYLQISKSWQLTSEFNPAY